MASATSLETTPQRLLVVYCGGTFGMTDRGNGLQVSPDLEAECARLFEQHQLAGSFSWTYVALDEVIDSAEVDPEQALHVAGLLRAHLRDADAAVVIHGTDTLTYTSAVAAFALMDFQQPVVFTGSQRSLFETESDAGANFELAVTAALTSTSPGLHIAFGGALLPATRALKVATSDVRGFAAYRPSQVEPTSALLPNLSSLDRFAVPGEAAPRIGVVRMFPGITAAIVECYLDEFPDGLVVEAFGAGTAPMGVPGLQESLARAAQEGVPIVVVSQCLTGSVTLERYAVGARLMEAGVLSGHDLTTDAALAKLLVMRAVNVHGETLHHALETNYIGEMVTTPHVEQRTPADDARPVHAWNHSKESVR